jgi:kinesin family protein 2/24
MFIDHHTFGFDRVFDEATDNERVYREAAAPLIKIACEGGFATCFMYGQTGSGKTYTMSSIYDKAATELFKRLNKANKASKGGAQCTVSVSFIEIAGDAVHDLLNGFTPAQLLSGVDGGVHAFPIVEPVDCPHLTRLTALHTIHARSMA